MKRQIMVFAGILVLMLGAVVLAGPTRTLKGNYKLPSGDELFIDLSVGSVTVESSNSNQVDIEVHAECKRGRNCEALLQDVEIVASNRSGHLRLKIERPDSRNEDNLEIEVQLRVPRGAPVELDLGVGSVQVYDLENDLKVDVGVGDVDVELPERQVGDVKLDVGVGKARLRGGNSGERETDDGFLGSTIRWRRGPGRADVNVHVGVGDISMSLK